MLSIRELDRMKVLGEPNKKTGVRHKVGSVGYALFHPTELRVVGFAIERSDLALMIERKDLYVALDRVAIADGELVADGPAAWGDAAAERLGIDWETTVAWAGMPVRTESGVSLGTVRDALVAENTGELNALGLSAGTTRDAAIGVRDLPAQKVRGFDGEFVIVADEAAEVPVDGGAAAVAGKAAAVAKVKAEIAGDAAAEKFDGVAVAAGGAAGKAAAYAKVKVKAAAKSEQGKKAIGWFKALKDGVVDSMGDSEK